MSTFVGNAAEEAAALYLEGLGYKIIDRNWKTRLCEIDIVAQMKKTIHFVEVKYRRTSGQGGGLEHITPKKLEQMRFAARCWVQETNYKGDYELSALEVSANFEVTEFIEFIN